MKQQNTGYKHMEKQWLAWGFDMIRRLNHTDGISGRGLDKVILFTILIILFVPTFEMGHTLSDIHDMRRLRDSVAERDSSDITEEIKKYFLNPFYTHRGRFMPLFIPYIVDSGAKSIRSFLRYGNT